MGVLRYFPGSEPRPEQGENGDRTGERPDHEAEGTAAPVPSASRPLPPGLRPGEPVSARRNGRGVDGPGVDEPGVDEPRVDEPGVDESGWVVPGLEPAGTRDTVSSALGAADGGRGARRASNVSMAALTRADASEAELRAKLLGRGLEADDVDAEIERLKGVGLVDDEALATRLVHSLRERKGLGDAALRPALRARRIPQSVVDAVLAAETVDPEESEDRLQELADDRARRLRGLAPDVAERRLVAFLQRKGYSGSAVRTAARQALGGA